MPKKIEVRLTSTEFVHSPGLFAWAVAGYRNDDRPKMVDVISKTFNLRPKFAEGLLSGKIRTRIKGDVVIFRAEPGTYLLPPPQPSGPKCLVETLTHEELEDAVRQIQHILWLDMSTEPERWDAEKEFDSETADAVAGVLHDLGLAPESEETE